MSSSSTPIVETTTSTATTTDAASAITAPPLPAATVALLPKVHTGEGFRLTFELKGRIPELMSFVSQETNCSQELGVSDRSLHGDSTLPSSVGGGSKAPESGKDTAVACPANNASKEIKDGYHPVPDSNSIPQGSNVNTDATADAPLKDHAFSVVHLQQSSPALQGNNQEHGARTHTWDWSYPSKDHVEGDLLGHKSVFAFLCKNPTSGIIEILSQFAFWILNSPGQERIAGSRYSASQPSQSSSGGRHWRRASTPERFTSNIHKSSSFHAKGPSAPSNHSSLASLPDTTAVAGVSNTDNSGSNTGISTALNSTAMAIDTEDGPLFRATVVECENHIRDMKASTKRIIKTAQSLLDTRKSWIAAEEAFVKELEGFKAAEPLLVNYLRPMSQSLAERSEMLDYQMRNLLIEPLSRFYGNDLKVAETHRKTFDDESKEYYQFLSRYMAMKQESNRKKGEADAKYDKKRRQFEIKRFEYWGFLLDMRVGGSKSDELLHHLTNYSEKHCRSMVDVAILAEDLKPGLDSIAADLLESHKRAAVIRKERQERRKELLEPSDDGNLVSQSPSGHARSSSILGATSMIISSLTNNNPDVPAESHTDTLSTSQELASDQGENTAGSVFGVTRHSNNSNPKFSGIRDLEHQDIDAGSALGRRKEGFLFATSRPSMHNNSVVLEKPSINWHKYWCVVSEGHLHEYSHWKKGATMLHNEPIDLRLSTVRSCRNQDRRFCFEVITPKYRRVYQATSAEDMNSWISVISNAIQSLLDGTTSSQYFGIYSSGRDPKSGLEGLFQGTAMTGRSSMDQIPQNQSSDRQRAINSFNGSGDSSGAKDMETADSDHLGTRLLQTMRRAHPANNVCAECGAKNPDWCAINLGILICIECSGIHRSLGTHISKVRSFTLDTTSYTRDVFDFIRAVGNHVSNHIWEANLVQPTQDGQPMEQLPNKVVLRRPVVNDTREYKVTFIQQKYVERAFVDRIQFVTGQESQEEAGALATKALFQAAIANNIPGVISAVAAGADLNATQDAELDDEDGVTSGSELINTEPSDTTGSSLVSESETRPESGQDGAIQKQDPQQVQQLQPPRLETRSPSEAERSSYFRVMETSPLLIALRHGAPFSLDEQYEVYPMAEYMLQNGATSNLSVKVKLINDEAETTNDKRGGSVEGTTATQSNKTDPSKNTPKDTPNTSNNNGWDATEVDPEDIRHFQQRSNRRSLGEVVHMRGEGGGTAIEYLRAKSAARGDPMPGSSSSNMYNDSAVATSTSPPLSSSDPTILSPHPSPQGALLGSGTISASSSVASSPSASGNYSTSVHRKKSLNTHQDISTLFQRRRESDSGIGQALFPTTKSSDTDKSSKSNMAKSTDYALQNAAPIAPSHLAYHEFAEPLPYTSHTHLSPQHASHSTSSRANKVKASLSKSLRLSAAYIKNNMMKDDRDLIMPPPVSTASSHHTDAASAVSASGGTSTETPTSSSSVPSAGAQAHSDLPLSGSYVILHKKGPNT
ncbi:hypothetical protein BG011_003803 [Mortierella polycephala]|uniref:ArfGap-domain-containing protein n=1 Tax=Mortierella polycephala TaxID=41804 RepID=A0A9P6U375_9FUNG|nr:hypothetical protein BG011_003803 [Mortierella polycephala]